MNYAEFNKNLKEDRISSLYLFNGEERYLIDDTILRIKDKYIDKSLESLNYTVLNGKSTSQDDIINACETLPFMSPKKVVILNELGTFLENGITDEKEFYQYLGNLGDHCLLIVVDRNSELKKTTKFYKYFKKNNCIVEFNKLTKNQLQAWINNQLKNKNKEMSSSNINLFLDRSSYFNRNNDTDLYNLKGELDKLINYSDGIELKRDDIENISQNTEDNSIFDMLGYISDGKTDEALQVFNQLYLSNEPALKILFMITRQIRLLLNYKLYREKGYDDNQIRTKIKISPYELKKISQQSKRHDIGKLKKYFNHLLLIDKRLKTSGNNEKLEMEMLIIKISSGTI